VTAIAQALSWAVSGVAAATVHAAVAATGTSAAVLLVGIAAGLIARASAQ